MAVKLRQLFLTPEYRKTLLVILSVQLVILFLFLLFTVVLSGMVSGNMDALVYALTARVAAEYPDAREDVVALFTQDVRSEDVRAGEAILADYGYTASLSTLRKPLFRGMFPFILGGAFLLVGLSLGLTFLFFTWSERKLFGKIDRLSLCIDDILEERFRFGESAYDDGLWSLFVIRFNQMVKKLQDGSEQLRKDKQFLQGTLSDISHQLKTPLASLTMFTDLMLETPSMDAATRSEFLRQNEGQLRRMEWLVKSLLKLARLETGSIQYVRQPVELLTLLRNVCEELSPLRDRRSLSVRGNQGEGYLVQGDVNWLHEAFTNIVKNAVQHTDPESGWIRISLSRTALFLRVSIEDNGGGIPEAELPRLFERFFKGSSSVSMESVGIGLSLAKMIITGHGGDIRVRNREPSGAEFIVTFPD